MVGRCRLLLAGVALGLAYCVVLLRRATEGAASAGRPTMRSVHFSGYGAPSDVLEMVDLPVPSYRAWEVLVEVHAASINPVDYKIVQGAFFLIDFALTHRPGFDFSGRVVAVGKGCTRVKVGQMVHGMTWVYKTGTLAEYLAVDESAINVVPGGMTPQEAAALPLVAHSSYSSLVTVGGLRQGGRQRVLVLGGSSATGMVALQLAKAFDAAHVVSTCSPRNAALVRQLGADETVDYREEDVFAKMSKDKKTFDIIYDTVGAGRSVWEGASSGVLARGGRLVTITGDVQRTLDIKDLLSRGYHIVSRRLYCLLFLGGGGYHQHTQLGGDHGELAVLDELVRAGKLRAVVDRTYRFDLDQVKEAFKYLMAGRAAGKVVITIKP